MKKVVILIDGQNLFYDLRGMNLKEKQIDWTKLFADITGENEEFIRAYWFRADRISGFTTNPDAIENLVVKSKFPRIFSQYVEKGLNGLSPEIRKEILDERDKVVQWNELAQQKFDRSERAFEQLCITHNNIEVVKAGVVKVDSIKKEYIGEKGVDIAVAVKMIELSIGEKCDKIILMSGDYDYIEAIRFVKDNLTKFEILTFLKESAPNSTAKGLSVIADRTIEISESDLKTKYKQEG